MSSREPRRHNRARIWADRIRRRGDSPYHGATGPWPDHDDAAAGITRRSAIFASAAAVSVITDYPDYSEHVANADQIANTGVPLLTMSQTLLKSGTQVIAASGLYNPALMTVTQPSVEILMHAQFASGTAVPFIQGQLAWIDSPSAIGVETDIFYAPGAVTAPGWASIFKGPTKGSQLDLLLNNLDSVNSATVDILILQNSRTYTDEVFRGINAVNTGRTVPGFTMPVLPGDNDILGIVANQAIGAGASLPFLFSPHKGLVNVGIEMNAGAVSNLTVSLRNVPDTVYGGGHNFLGAFPNPVGGFQVASGRAPILVHLANSATASITVTCGLVAASQ